MNNSGGLCSHTTPTDTDALHTYLTADNCRKIPGEKDLSFLKEGIYGMLSTRLAQEDQVEAISQATVEDALQAVSGSGSINDASARNIGTRLNADFVLFGSLAVFESSVIEDNFNI
jgi:hypothetical protein